MFAYKELNFTMSRIHFTQLVCTDLCHGGSVCFRVVLDRNLSSHTADSVHASLVAGLYQKAHVGIHERHSHCGLVAIWEYKARMLAEALYHAKDVIPSTTVQSSTVLPQLIDNLFHFKSCQDGFDQDRGTNGASRGMQHILRSDENVVPESKFKGVF